MVVVECLLWIGNILDAGYTLTNKADVVLALTMRQADINQTQKDMDSCNGKQCDKGLALGTENVE